MSKLVSEPKVASVIGMSVLWSLYRRPRSLWEKETAFLRRIGRGVNRVQTP